MKKTELLVQNPNLNHLAKPSFQGVNRMFDLAFENDTQKTSNERYFLLNKIKTIMLWLWKNIFGQAVKNDKIIKW